MTEGDWKKALGEAKNALGKDGDVPIKRMAAVFKAESDYVSLFNGFNATREALEKKLLEMQNALSKVKNTMVQAEDEITASSYGLDEKKPDEKKKVDKAQAALEKYFDDAKGDVDIRIKNADELDKHLIQIARYKQK
jgi:hypothetical protein